MADLDVVYICLNMRDPVVGRNRKLRQALQLGYDVETVVSRFYNGRGIRAHGVIPPGLFGYEEGYRNPFGVYDVTRAQKLLAEAGYPGGRGLPELVFLTVANTELSTVMGRLAGDSARESLSPIAWPPRMPPPAKATLKTRGQ